MFSIHFVDKKRKMDGEDVYLLPDRLLSASVISSKEAVKVISKIAEKVAKTTVPARSSLSKTKTYLVENAENADSFSPQEMGADVFGGSPAMAQEFQQQVAEAKLPDVVAIEKNTSRKRPQS